MQKFTSKFNHDKQLPTPPPGIPSPKGVVSKPHDNSESPPPPPVPMKFQGPLRTRQAPLPPAPPRPAPPTSHLNIPARYPQRSSEEASEAGIPTPLHTRPEAALNSEMVSGNRNSVYSVQSQNSSLFKPKTLKRRNLKALTIADSISNPAAQSKLNDPEIKTSTDELVSSMNNLELGLEYQLNIKADDLLTLKKLGSGNSGTVTKVLHLPSKKTMARKVIHMETKQAVLKQIVRELRIMHECDSPSIIGFYGAFLKEGDVVICMEYADCGSLDKVLAVSGPFPEYMLKQTAYSVLTGLIYLYNTHKIIHRDVKPSNVLMDSRGNMKLCDFGVSRELINSIADTFVGTSTYMSPERIQGNRYTIKGDVWSLGLMMIELATGSFPFGDSSKMAPEGILDLLQRIVNESPPSLQPREGISPELCDFVDRCLTKESERWDPQELINHPFLADAQSHTDQVKKWSYTVRKLQKGKVITAPK